MADAFQAASRGYFRLEEDEALQVNVPVADCRYTNIQLTNPWMESLDYASHQSSQNHRTAHVDADGRVRYVIGRRILAYRTGWTPPAGPRGRSVPGGRIAPSIRPGFQRRW